MPNDVAQEQLVVERVNQYGIVSAGKNYSISTKLAGTGVRPESFIVGSTIIAQVWTGPKGGKKINSYQVAGQPAAPVAPPAAPYVPPVAAAPAPVVQQPPMPPSLPVTNVASTPAPGGVAPVATTAKGYANGNGTTEDKMSKADWAVRNNEIAIQAIVKSSLESHALGEHVTGKSTAEFLELTRTFVKHNLETYRLAVQGQL